MFQGDQGAAEVVEKPCRHADERRLERERVARDLHDSLLQGLLGVSLQLQAAVGQVPADSGCRAALDHATLRMRQVIDEARDILLGLRSSAIGPMSLDEAFASLKDEFAPSDGVRFQVRITGQPQPLAPAIREQIYLIGREALINALRHSEATRIEAEVEYRAGGLRVRVRDNGCGIDSKIIRSGRHAHWGLAGMRERADGIGAELRIWSSPGSGTEVEIRIPNRTLAEAGIDLRGQI